MVIGTGWLDVPEPIATLFRHHLLNRSNMSTAANPASPWLFPGRLAGEHRSYRRLIVILSRLGIPARASRLASCHRLVRQAPPAVLAAALGISPDTATRYALLAGGDWATYASRRSTLATPEYQAATVARGHRHSLCLPRRVPGLTVRESRLRVASGRQGSQPHWRQVTTTS